MLEKAGEKQDYLPKKVPREVETFSPGARQATRKLLAQLFLNIEGKQLPGANYLEGPLFRNKKREIKTFSAERNLSDSVASTLSKERLQKVLI